MVRDLHTDHREIIHFHPPHGRKSRDRLARHAPQSASQGEGKRMAYFSQQFINAITLGAIYGLIAIGYTMVYGIIGMINFAHGDVFMIGAFISLIGFMICAMLGIGWAPLAIVLVLLVSMAFTAVYGWAIERTAYRPLRGSFKLAPLISAIGVSILLQNYVRLAQGARPKPAGQIVEGGFNLFSADGFDVRVAWLQIIIVVVTVALMAGFSWLIAATPLGRQQRATVTT